MSFRFKAIILLLTACNLLAMEEPPANSKVYDIVFSECSPALSKHESSMSAIYCATDDDSKHLAQVSSKQMALSEHDEFVRVIDIFKGKSKRKIASRKTIQKLELLAGKNEASRNRSFLAQFPVHTTVGKMLLAKRLVSKYNTAEVKEFQKLVKMFISRERDCQAVQAHMKTVKRSEPTLLSLWASDFNFKDLISDYVAKRTPEIPLYGAVGAENIGFVNATVADYNAQARWWNGFTHWLLNKFTKVDVKSDAYVKTLRVLLARKTDSMLNFVAATRSIYDSVKDMLVVNDDPEINKLRREMNNIPKITVGGHKRTPVEVLSLALKIMVLLGKHKSHRLKSRLKIFLDAEKTKHLVNLKKQLDKTDSTMTKLGTYFQITSLLYSMKPDFLKVYKTLGTIDQLSSIAHLTLASKEKPFCFVQFDGENKASFKLQDYWNCMLSDKIVSNSLEVKKHEPHLIVIGGINGTGKTTALRAIGLCMHLGSTIGVAPAKQCIMPKPLSVLASLDERDNLASQNQGGLSLFQAQVKALADIAKNIKDNSKLSVVVIDEPCTATSENNAMIAMNAFFEKMLPLKKKFVCLLTTHFEGVRSRVEKDPENFRLLVGQKNYKVTDGKNKGINYGVVKDKILSMFKF